jgi:hypothetical protein
MRACRVRTFLLISYPVNPAFEGMTVAEIAGITERDEVTTLLELSQAAEDHRRETGEDLATQDTGDTQALRQIFEVTRKLVAPFNLDTILTEVVNASREVLNAERGTVFLYDNANDGLVVRAGTELEQIHIPAAKGLLMLREQGFLDKPGEETKAKLEELKFLVSSIGPTGLRALKPFLRMSRKDLWQFYMLSN